ncbi:hypothetical protein [Alkanindiges illinoisensis]|uniref:Uncharacterized protein n=1 Tax=Alkanindiges illinoisensis TaxID=197183 RepID=A0A4Y7X8P1_9GAMM|nr:hypothetical protein [Alkanindiges illinoisensis]TEU23388.1 hypothetical protein E2B99_13825 [Alkanindiges illinoisensis]
MATLVPMLIVDYLPWEAGYKQGTGEYSGHSSARFMKSARECTLDPDVANDEAFQRGCRAFFD